MNRKVFRLARRIWPALVLFALMAPGPAGACDPLPWYLAELGEEACAAFVGRVTAVSADGRQATIEVSEYLGPGEPPRTVHLPPTEDGSFATCPDLSIRFTEGREYLVLLARTPPRLALLRPKGPTAFPVAEDGTVEIDIVGHREPLSEVVAGLAERSGRSRREPGSSSQVWQPASG